MAIQVIHRINLWKKLFVLIPFSVLSGVGILAVSTLLSVVGLGGYTTVKHHYGFVVAQSSTDLEAVKQYRDKEQELLEITQNFSAYFQSELDQMNEGDASEETLPLVFVKRLLTFVENIRTTVEDGYEPVDAMYVQAFNKVSNLNYVVNAQTKNTSLKEWLRDVDVLLSETHALTNEMLLGSRVHVVKSELINGQVFMKDSFLPPEYKKYVIELDRFIAQMMKRIDDIERSKPNVHDVEFMSVYESVLQYYKQIMPQWFVSIGLDFFGYVGLLLVLVFAAPQRRVTQP